jgi:hypothetical protein
MDGDPALVAFFAIARWSALAARGARFILMMMSSLVRHGCWALAVVAAAGCTPRAASPARHAGTEARNAERAKKPDKRRPLVAPPPAYGNKIVLERASRPSGADAGLIAL